jgi:hypothetical protein
MHPSRCVQGGCVFGLALIATSSCLQRPVARSEPHTNVVFSDVITQSAVDKVDLLFMIDNSRSMGDKQDYLAKAVPDLLTRLLTPNCLDGTGAPNGLVADTNGNCAKGTPEFHPVHDMHIGIVSSSLGSLGGNVCDLTTPAPVPNGEDDDGQLLNRDSITDAKPSGFLDWFPSASGAQSSGPPPVTQGATLVSDFQGLVRGTGELGCGIEAQLESWYRFLVQPDPYAKVVVDHNGQTARFDGYDATVLRQRHDFLRPDSLLAIIDVSDENDSAVDVRAYPGTNVAGYHMMESDTGPYRATSACATNPADPACTSCDAQGAANDPACAPNARYDSGGTAAGEAPGTANIRHVRMKQNFGIDSQYPIDRYVQGLTSAMVPDRNGEYPSGAQTYQGMANCSNPIFSKDLPDGSNLDPAALCNLKPGPRSPSTGLVFYAHIGGVPHELLQVDPSNPDSPQKDTLSADDWAKILGKDPRHYDSTGIDPRMYETYKVRPFPSPVFDYWDLAFACTFPLAAPRDCKMVRNQAGCDCAFEKPLPGHDWELCDPNDPTQQIAAKAYPTVRELWLAQLLGKQGIVSSLCPIHPQPTNGDVPPDPLYGYRPAMNAIINQLKVPLAAPCIPHALQPDTQGAVPCLVLASLPAGETTCDPAKGESDVDPHVVADASQSLQGQFGPGAFDPSQHTICQVHELTGGDLANGTCKSSSQPGWCYVTGAAAGGRCPQTLLFSPPATPSTGTQVAFVCIESSSATTGNVTQ